MDTLINTHRNSPAGSEHPTVYSWEWPIGIGIFLIILGIVALAAPIATSVALAWLVGVLFISSGIAQLIHAFRCARERGTTGRFLLSALSIAAGIVIMRNPFLGTIGITMVLAFYLLVGAVGKWFLASDMRPAKGWGLLFVSSMISLVLGILLIVTLPATSLIVPGIFLGVDFIFYGSSLITFAFIARKAMHRLTEFEQRRAA